MTSETKDASPVERIVAAVVQEPVGALNEAEAYIASLRELSESERASLFRRLIPNDAERAFSEALAAYVIGVLNERDALRESAKQE
jgi:hypothetical protein